MVSFAEYLDEVLDAIWVRDYPEEYGGFEDDFLNDDPLYCSKRDNIKPLHWDSLGHLDVPTGDDDSIESSSSSSSSSSASAVRELSGCYAVGIIGRFYEGPCSSSSSVTECESSSFCQDDDHRLQRSYAIEEAPKDLKLCFDDLGHLAGIYVCGRLRWHQDGWYEGESSGGEVMLIESSSAGEGVELLAYLPMPEPSSSSSSCDTPYRSVCEPMTVRKVKLTFDGLGHLFMVSEYEEVLLPCGIQTECCEDPMPRSFLVSFKAWNSEMGVGGEARADEQCQVVHWNGCWWPGAVSMPCCVHTPGNPETTELTYEGLEIKIGCTLPPGPPGPVADPWVICIGAQQFTFQPADFTCCPLDARTGGFYSRGECDIVEFEVRLMEIPCDIQCVSGTFDCESPSSSTPDVPSSGGGPGPGGGGL